MILLLLQSVCVGGTVNENTEVNNLKRKSQFVYS